MRLSVVLLCCVLVRSGWAEDPVHFPDENLRAAVEEALYVSDPTPTDMLGLTSLSAYYKEIQDLRGLEYALNLQQLAITQCSLSDVSPLAGLTNLRSLVINNNDIHDISPLAGLVNLEYLDVHENDDILDISVLSGLLKLRTLILRKNAVSNISVLSGLTQLRDVSLMRNNISDISALSGLSSLQSIDLSHNRINRVPGLSGLDSLRTLDLANNQIRDISGLATLDALQDLDLYFNNISDISPLVNLTALTRLQLESNPLNDDAYDVYIPHITDENAGITLQYDERERPTLTVYSTIGGVVTTPGEGVFTYDRSDSVLLKAEATSGFSFVGWSGSFNLDANPFSFTIERDLEIRAHFLSTLDTIHVDDNAPEDVGPNDLTVSDPAENGAPGHPFDSIQEAIDVAGQNVTIVVRPGTYCETIDLLGKNITLTGIDPNDPNVSPLPVIDAAGQGPAVTFAHGEDPNCSLTGFVVTRGHGHPASALYCKASSPTIANCLIVGNRSSDPNGAAVYCIESHPALVNCTIADNDGGLMGTGLWAGDSTVAIVNSILWNNLPAEIQIQGDTAVSVAYSNVAGGWSGTGNLAAQPLFAQPGYWAILNDPNAPAAPGKVEAVWIDGDYHLQSQTGRWDPLGQLWLQDDMTCPCIDAGDPNGPLDNEPPPNGGAVNLGAYGGTGQASRSQ